MESQHLAQQHIIMGVMKWLPSLCMWLSDYHMMQWDKLAVYVCVSLCLFNRAFQLT